MAASQSSRGAYFIVFAVLLLLLVATVGAAHVYLGALAPVVALGIATVKAVLIGLIFMHLQHEAPLVRVFAVAGILWLGILLVLIASDYATRSAVTPAETRAPAMQR
jgi:cytochrome c oxidase subunit 4